MSLLVLVGLFAFVFKIISALAESTKKGESTQKLGLIGHQRLHIQIVFKNVSEKSYEQVCRF